MLLSICLLKSLMCICRIILELLKRREKSKKELLKLTVEIAEKR